jgi:hypothetical protein
VVNRNGVVVNKMVKQTQICGQHTSRSRNHIATGINTHYNLARKPEKEKLHNLNRELVLGEEYSKMVQSSLSVPII